FENDVARHLEQHIPPEEGAGGHAVNRRVEADILVHRQRGKADIDAVEITEKISQRRKGQDTQIDLAHRNLLERTDHSYSLGGFAALGGRSNIRRPTKRFV